MSGVATRSKQSAARVAVAARPVEHGASTSLPGNQNLGRILRRASASAGSGAGPLAKAYAGGNHVAAAALLNRGASTGNPLPSSVTASVSKKLGADVSGVRVHTGDFADRAATDLHAEAFTFGQDIYFRSGRYQPQSGNGQDLLHHELVHTLQQRSGMLGQSESLLEGHADRLAARSFAMFGNAPSTPRILRSPTSGTCTSIEITLPHTITFHGSEGDITMRTDLRDGVAPGKYRAHYDQSEHALKTDIEGGKGIVQTSGNLRGTKAQIKAQQDLFVSYLNSLTSDVDLIVHAPQNAPSGGGTANKPAGGTGDKKDAKSKDAKSKDAPKTDPDDKKTGTTKGKDAPPPTGATDPNSKGGKGTDPKTGDKPPTEGGPKPASPQENLKELEKLPKDVQDLLGGGTKIFDPKDYPQLLRIAQKLKMMTAEERVLYKQLSGVLSKNLDSFEASVDYFFQFREKILAQQKDAQAKPVDKKEQTLDQKLQENLDKNFDEKAWNAASGDKREAMARDLAAQQRNIQLKHMVTHPGETIAGMAEGIVRPDKVGKQILDDAKEVVNGSSTSAKLAGGAGALGKTAGYFAAILAVMAVAIMFIPPANLAALATALGARALALGVASIMLAGAESEFRIKAAREAKTTDEAKEQISKSGAAQATVFFAAGTIALGVFGEMMAKIPIGGKYQTLGGAFKVARTAAIEKSGIGPAWRDLRADLVTKLKAAKDSLKDPLASETKLMKQNADLIRKMSPTELVKKLAAGDPSVPKIELPKEQLDAVLKVADTEAGKTAAAGLKQEMLNAMDQATEQAAKKVQEFASQVDESVADLESAKTADDLEEALDRGTATYDPTAAAETERVTQQQNLTDRAIAEPFKGVSDDQVRAAAPKDPAAAFELERRYRALLDKKGGYAELQKIAKTDPRAKEILDTRPPRLKQDLRTSDPKLTGRMIRDIKKLRKDSGVERIPGKKSRANAYPEPGVPEAPAPEGGTQGGTLGIAETDLDLQNKKFSAGSPKVNKGAPAGVLDKDAPRHYKPGVDHPAAQFHAEEQLVNALRERIEAAKLTAEQMKGKKITAVIEQEVCSVCSQTLKKFSADYPELTIEITDVDTYGNKLKVTRIRGGKIL